MPNKRLFHVEQLLTLLKSTLALIDFDTESLTRDLKPTLDLLSPEFIAGIPLKICHICSNYGFNMSPDFMNLELGFNSDDWSRIAKYTFQHTAIIRKNDPAALKNWRCFSSSILNMCNDELDALCDLDNFNKFFKYPDINGVFKKFIGQLILDNNVNEAEAIHLMLKFAHVVIGNTHNGMTAADVALMLSITIFDGLQIDGIIDSEDVELSTTGFFGDEIYAKRLQAFKQGLIYVLEDPFFLNDFSIDLYKMYHQQYPTDLEKDNTDPKAKEHKKSKMISAKLYIPTFQLSRLKLSEYVIPTGQSEDNKTKLQTKFIQ